MEDKMRISLSPFACLSLLKTVQYLKDSLKDNTFIPLAYEEVFEEFNQEVLKNMSQEQLDDALAETSVNLLLNKLFEE